MEDLHETGNHPTETSVNRPPGLPGTTATGGSGHRDSIEYTGSTPTRTWLMFALALPDSAELCGHLRKSHPDPRACGRLIQLYLAGQDDALSRLLLDFRKPVCLKALSSDRVQHQCDRALDWQASEPGHHLLGLDHPAYPRLLRDTPDAPPLLYARGSLNALAHPLVAVVGSRKASHHALSHTRRLCTDLSSLGLGVVSGLALGIDAAAHEGALQATGAVRGPTIAVAATPPDRVYPTRHASLDQRIVETGGLILTEQALGSSVKRWFFPKRNRIISGLCMGVLVAEAGLPSGSLTTATHAMNQGREVMAMPGSLHNPHVRGCHALIKQGAALVECTNDILDTLGEPLQRELKQLRARLGLPDHSNTGMSQHPAQATLALEELDLSEPERAILHLLSADAAHIDELLSLTPLNISQLASLLGLLEIKGLITTTSGGRYARC